MTHILAGSNNLKLMSYLDAFYIPDMFQSGFRAFHSTESPLLKVRNDLLLSIDSESSAILILLDLSAAFDPIDHDILLNRLKCVLGVQGTDLAHLLFKGYDFFSKYWVVHLTFCTPPLWCSTGFYS